jgi:hypothetical protein
MNTPSIVLSSLLGLALVLLIAPSVIAMNRGKTLRNIALWLAIVFALGLVYQNFGPERSPLSSLPATQNGDASDDQQMDQTATPIEDQNYTPPRE